MKLASIEKILDIKPIQDADRIVAVKIKDYWTVMKKEEAVLGRLVVWHEPDTIIDKGNSVYSFLKDSRLRICKFKKQISQGLAVPAILFNLENLPEGSDVSELINITKYEKPIPAQLAGKIKGNFPFFLKKTDSERLQSNPGLFEEFVDKDVYVTIKYDGTSGTFYSKDGQFGVCSRNLELKDEENNLYWQMARKYSLDECLEGTNYCIQAECVGPGIQGNKLGLKENEIRVFDIWDIDKQEYVDFAALTWLCHAWDLPQAVCLYKGKFCWQNIEEVVEFTNQLRYENGALAEGIVVRPVVEHTSDTLGGKRLAFKSISENFALKNKE